MSIGYDNGITVSDEEIKKYFYERYKELGPGVEAAFRQAITTDIAYILRDKVLAEKALNFLQ